MPRKVRVLSRPAATVLKRFLDEPTKELHGFQIIKEARIPASTLYPVLRALAEQRQFLIWRSEDIDPRVEQRPPRRLYRLNGNAADAAWAAYREYEAYHDRPPSMVRPRPLGGEA